MIEAIKSTNFKFTGLKHLYHGKVRDVYNINDKYLVMVATDRISAFDVVLPKGIPFKGQVLNQVAAKFLDATADIVPNWKIVSPDPMVSIGHFAEPFKVEMVIRGYLTGHAWREYRAGKRELCGIPLPDGMKEHQKFDKPIITPTTKATEGHDEDIPREDVISQGLVSGEDYSKLEDYTYKLFSKGSEIAQKMGLILVDTKYEFGLKDDELIVIDEIHTQDSSRFWILNSYDDKFSKGEAPEILDKEIFRGWLMETYPDIFPNIKPEQEIPPISEDIKIELAKRYMKSYENITGTEFKPFVSNAYERIQENLKKAKYL